MEPLNNIALKILQTKTLEEKLSLCDKAFNVVHPRGDIASLFIEGGSRSLYELSLEHEELSN